MIHTFRRGQGHMDWMTWTPEAKAAWAQAILSALAIWYSGRLAFGQARAAKRERVDTYIQMLAISQTAAWGARRFIGEGKTFPVGGDIFGFAKLQKDFEAISFHDVPHHKLVPILRDAAEACRMLDQNCDQLLNTAKVPNVLNASAIAEAADVLEQCYTEAIHISVRLHGPLERCLLEMKIELRRLLVRIKQCLRTGID